MSGVRRAVAFLTPLGGPATPTAGTLNWFPLVGAVMGLGLGGWWWVADRAWPAPVAAALVVAADLALTGMLHFDGLLDTADGLLPHLSRERRLAVMAEPTVGGFAVAVGAAVVLARWAAISSLAPAPWLVGGLWCGSRTLMAGVVSTQPYARSEGGLASAFWAPQVSPPSPLGRLVPWPWPRPGAHCPEPSPWPRASWPAWGSWPWPGAGSAVSPATFWAPPGWWARRSA